MSEDKKKLLGIDWEHEHRRRITEKIYGIYRPEDDLPKQPPKLERSTVKSRRAAILKKKKVTVSRKLAPEMTKEYLKIASYLAQQRLFGKCNWCNHHHNLTYDHIYPTSKGGCKCKGNVQILCAPCNGRKGNTILKDTSGRAFGHTQEDCPFKKEKKS